MTILQKVALSRRQFTKGCGSSQQAHWLGQPSRQPFMHLLARRVRSVFVKTFSLSSKSRIGFQRLKRR